jgi:hypothetical protein
MKMHELSVVVAAISLPRWVRRRWNQRRTPADSRHRDAEVRESGFGAFQNSYALIGDAAAALKAWQIGGCPYHLRGWLLWTWDTAEQYPGLWADQAGDGSIDQVLAPAWRPDPCAP